MPLPLFHVDAFDREFQASARGGVVKVRVVGDRAMLGGRAVTVARRELLVEEDEP
jgi:hypothetical protein